MLLGLLERTTLFWIMDMVALVSSVHSSVTVTAFAELHWSVFLSERHLPSLESLYESFLNSSPVLHGLNDILPERSDWQSTEEVIDCIELLVSDLFNLLHAYVVFPGGLPLNHC